MPQENPRTYTETHDNNQANCKLESGMRLRVSLWIMLTPFLTHWWFVACRLSDLVT